jgi:predicted DNA-binding protein with PD1-like motif
MRHIAHPGPASLERTVDVAGAPVPLRFVLEPGETVDAAIARGFEAAGCIGGFVTLRGGACDPFRFVMPAASPDADHVAWYSDTFAPVGPVRIERAGAIVGQREGRSFVHCHGIWETSDGTQMGHMLAPDTKVVETIEATGFGSEGSTFLAVPDPETNFTLFEPVRVAGDDAGRAGARLLLAKVRPNEDISLAIEAICADHRITNANVHGIGSLNEVRFTDGRRVEAHATEVLIREGFVVNDRGNPRASLKVDLVDLEGRIHSGQIVHGDNPVCITFELVIEDLDQSHGQSIRPMN